MLVHKSYCYANDEIAGLLSLRPAGLPNLQTQKLVSARLGLFDSSLAPPGDSTAYCVFILVWLPVRQTVQLP